MSRRSAEVELLVNDVVHSLNNPATYLLTNLSTLSDDPEFIRDDPEEAQEMLDECVEGVRRIVEIARELRDYVRETSEQTGTVDLEDVVYSAVRVARFRFSEAITVTLESVGTPEITGAQGTIARLVLDVILQAGSNVHGQTDPPSVVDVSMSVADSSAIIEVGDNGPVPLLAGDSLVTGQPVTLEDRRWTDMGFIVSLQLARQYGGDLRFVKRAPRGRAIQIRLPI